MAIMHNEPGYTAVPPTDMWLLLLSAVRYALGRSSYIVDHTCEAVLRYRRSLMPAQLKQIRDEVAEEIRRAELDHKRLGMDQDHRRWIRFVEELKA